MNLEVSVNSWLTMEPNINSPKVLYISLASLGPVKDSECLRSAVSTRAMMMAGRL